jgi:glutamine synthetase
LVETKKIRFEGDGYSKEWRDEAARRGLPNLATARESFEEVKKADVLTEMSIFTKDELSARYFVMAESYCSSSIIDAETISLIASQTFIPKTIHYLSKVGGVVTSKKSPLGTYAQKFHQLLENTVKSVDSLRKLLKKCES